ncbi:MAG: GAF domain-containing protein [Anaerolineae bacterium]|nr:GAF domain-containing protein [Anaerolineae bacterium]
MNMPLRVLIIEDSEDDTLLIIRALRRGGYKDLTFHRVDTHADMETALQEKWDVVISDYSMPKFSGLDALKLIQTKKLDLPFIIVSGTIGEDIAVESMRAGAYDYLMKDNLIRLAPAVQRELQEARSREARRKAEKEKNQLIERLQTQHNTLMELVAHPAIATDQRDQALQAILQAAANTLAVSRVKVWQFLDQGDSMQCIQEYPLPREETPKKIIDFSMHIQQLTRIKSGKIMVIPDVFTNPKVPDWSYTYCKTQDIRSIIVVPIYLQGRVVGIVCYEDMSNPRQWTPDEITFTNQVANLLAQALLNLENARLLSAEAERRREAETLQAITQALSATLDLPQVLDLILSQLEKVVPYDSASVQQRTGEKLELMGGRGFANIEELQGLTFDLTLEDSPNSLVVQNRAPVILENAPELYAKFNTPPYSETKISSWLGVPLIFGNQIIGIITLDKKEPGFYNQKHARLAQAFAAQAAIAIENARLFAEEERRATELARALEQQKELANLKNQFIQNVSHELRTPLAIARGYAELLYSGELGKLPPESQSAIEIITRRTRMLTKLIEDINAILEIETQEPEYQPVNIAELIMKHVPDFKAAAAIAGLELITDVQSNTALIYGDPTQLDRVLDNLLGNALKFTPQGGSIYVQLKQHDQTLILEVQDTGIGIPEDKLDRIFERFYQVDGSASRRYGGTGLGLALVKEICEMHNGTVEVKSTLGVGSTFRVTLPIQ